MELSNFKYFLVLLFVTYGNTSQDDGPIVTTNSGKVRGFIDRSSKGKSYYTFHNIPFAEPPTGKLRFKNPKEGKPWHGIRDGFQPPVGCSSPDLFTYLKNGTVVYEGQEDCLYLSIYTPKIEQELLPVLLYIHGGAFLSISSAGYNGYELMNEEVVLVSIDYRLGILGFLSTNDDVMPGNLGLKDQTLALKWIQENIKYFGGDPSRVTIFGISAGGASVHYHILSPESKGLFTRAILQSGNALCPWTHSEGQRGIALQVGAAVGCFTPAHIETKQSELLLSCLQDVDAEELSMTFKDFVTWNFLPNIFVPYVDGSYIPDQPEILLKEGRHNNVDIMIGVTKDDGAWLTESLYFENDQIQRLQDEFDYYGPISLGLNYENDSLSITKQVFQQYLGNLKVTEENANEVTKMYGDAHFIISSDIVAFMHSENMKSSEKKVYSYQLDYKGQRSLLDVYQIKFGMHWIAHGDEGFLLFPKHKQGGYPNRNEDDAHMRDVFTKLWANFAATGNPTPDDSMGFRWTPLTKESPRHLSIKMKSEMKADERIEIRQFWSSLNIRQNAWLQGKTNKQNAAKSEL